MRTSDGTTALETTGSPGNVPSASSTAGQPLLHLSEAWSGFGIGFGFRLGLNAGIHTSEILYCTGGAAHQ